MDVRLRCCSRPPRRRLAFSRHAGVLLGLPRGVGPSKRPSARPVHSSAIDDGVLRARSVRPSSEPTLVANTARSSDRMRIARRCISHGSLSLHVSLAARLRFSVQEYPVCALNMLRKKSATHIPVYQRHWTWCGALYIHGSLRAAESPLPLRSVWSSRLRVTHATWSGARGFGACGAALSRACEDRLIEKPAAMCCRSTRSICGALVLSGRKAPTISRSVRFRSDVSRASSNSGCAVLVLLYAQSTSASTCT